MDLALQKCFLEQNFQLLNPANPQTLDLWFYKCQGKQKVCVGHYEKNVSYSKTSITDTPQTLGL